MSRHTYERVVYRVEWHATLHTCHTTHMPHCTPDTMSHHVPMPHNWMRHITRMNASCHESCHTTHMTPCHTTHMPHYTHATLHTCHTTHTPHYTHATWHTCHTAHATLHTCHMKPCHTTHMPHCTHATWNHVTLHTCHTAQMTPYHPMKPCQTFRCNIKHLHVPHHTYEHVMSRTPFLSLRLHKQTPPYFCFLCNPFFFLCNPFSRPICMTSPEKSFWDLFIQKNSSAKDNWRLIYVFLDFLMQFQTHLCILKLIWYSKYFLWGKYISDIFEQIYVLALCLRKRRVVHYSFH